MTRLDPRASLEARVGHDPQRRDDDVDGNGDQRQDQRNRDRERVEQ